MIEGIYRDFRIYRKHNIMVASHIGKRLVYRGTRKHVSSLVDKYYGIKHPVN